MGIFLDTGFFFALKFKKDPNYQRANKILKEISQKKFGTQFTSDFIIDELMTLTWNRTKNKKLISQMWDFFVPPNIICNILFITASDIPQIYDKFFKLLGKNKFISFTDASNLVIMQKFNISNIASFDSNFDGLITRIY